MRWGLDFSSPFPFASTGRGGSSQRQAVSLKSSGSGWIRLDPDILSCQSVRSLKAGRQGDDFIEIVSGSPAPTGCVKNR